MTKLWSDNAARRDRERKRADRDRRARDRRRRIENVTHPIRSARRRWLW